MTDQATNPQTQASTPAATSEAESLMVSSDSHDLDGLTEAELEILTRPAADTSAADAQAKADAEAAAKAELDKEYKPVVEPVKDEAPVGKPTTRDPSFVPRLSDPNAPAVDYDAELAKLDTQLDAGDITAAEYRKAERDLIKAQAKSEALAEADARIISSNAQFQTQLLNVAITNFFSDAAHQDFVKDAKGEGPSPEWRGAFQKAIDFVDNGSVAPTELAERAYNVLKTTRPDLFVKPVKGASADTKDADDKAEADKAAAEKKALAEAAKTRKPKEVKDLPPTLSEVPNAGQDDNENVTVLDQLAELDIEELEQKLAMMKPGEVEEILASTPGSKVRAH